MIHHKNKNNVIISGGGYEVEYQRKRKGLLVDRRDWERIKTMVKHSVQPPKWYDIAATLCFTAFVSLLLFGFTCSRQLASSIWVASGSLAFLGLVFLHVGSRDRRSSVYERDQILREMRDIELSVMKDEKQVPDEIKHTKQLEAWTAVNRPANRQGVDYQEIPLNGKRLRGLSFRVRPTDTYWRAGFKLEATNAAQAMPILVTKNSLLCHLGRSEDGGLGLTIFHFGDGLFQDHIALDKGDTQEVSMSMEIDDEDYLDCFVNDSLEYHLHINPDFLDRAFLAAWGDGRDYKVVFHDIAYSTY